MTAFFELAVMSNFSFLEGASHPDEYAWATRALGLGGFGLADRNTLAGVVRAHLAAKAAGVAFVPGCRLVLQDAPEILCYPASRAAYGRLAKLLSLGKMRAPKGACWLWLEDLIRAGEGQILIVLPPDGPARANGAFAETLTRLARHFPGNVFLAARRLFGPSDHRHLAACARLAAEAGAPLVAAGDVRYHAPERRPLADMLACIRYGMSIDEAGLRLAPNAERYLKSPDETARLFAGYEAALARAGAIAGRLAFSLDELAYEYPDEPCEGFSSPQEALAHFACEGAAERYPQGVPERVRAALDYELKIIAELDYAPYFLTVYDLVRFARSRGILCQGRGSAANSAVCYCLGITSVDPAEIDLLFERFVSAARGEPPDIDVDFEHERREEVIQYIYEKYGRRRAGIAATVITYRAKSAIRDAGKALGLSRDVLDKLAGTVWGGSGRGLDTEAVRRAGLDPDEPRLAHALSLAGELIGFPRHLGQHSGGFVITRGPLDEVIPVGNAAMDGRSFVEWDKDDLDRLGMLKIDVLSLGMLTCLSKGFELLARHYGCALDLARLPREDPAVYAMCAKADTVGVFQIESRAQMSMLPRLRPACFYDLVIEVAIVRPGPIQGDMVHPYLARRQGREAVVFPSDELREVLGRTLGVPLFQEQAMKIAIVAAGFTPAEADRLRRAMAAWRKSGDLARFRMRMIEGMAARGYTRDFAERCFRQIEGFGEYGFPESHAASFALLVYASAWLKCHYPDVFCCAILNSQPMGFYAPAQLIRDAKAHGVEVRPVDVNHSDWDCVLEDEVSASRQPVSSFRTLGEPEGPKGIRFASLASRNPGTSTDRNHAPSVLLDSGHPGLPAKSEIRGKPGSEMTDCLYDPPPRFAVRLGLRQVKGLRRADAERLLAARPAGGYASLHDLRRRAELSPSALERLAEADAFASLGLDRRRAWWEIAALGRGGACAAPEDLPLFAAAAGEAPLQDEPEAALKEMPLHQAVGEDYRSLRLSLKAHPVAFLRAHLTARNIRACADLAAAADGERLAAAGLVMVRQRPGSAKGVIFMTLEDETGIANIIVWPKVFARFRATALGARMMAVSGRLQSEDGVVHLIAHRLADLTGHLARALDGTLPPPDSHRRDEARTGPCTESRALAAERYAARASHATALLPKGRNFH